MFASLSDNTHSKNSGGSASPSFDSSCNIQQNNVYGIFLKKIEIEKVFAIKIITSRMNHKIYQ